jgi:hypothetical protein
MDSLNFPGGIVIRAAQARPARDSVAVTKAK